LQWCAPIHADPVKLAPADRPILQALRLPVRYPITPDVASPTDMEAWYVRLRDAITRGERLLQLRLPQWPPAQVRELAKRLQPLALAHDAQLLLNADIEGALQLGVGVGVHLKSAQLAQLAERPLPWQQPVGASCHDAGQLMQAVRLSADFATLSPLAVTASHPNASPLGWAQFHAMVEAAALPVYALGGVSPAQLTQVQQAGGQGVAGIRAFW
jgi:8-oxo-dGTP diphosphatase